MDLNNQITELKNNKITLDPLNQTNQSMPSNMRSPRLSFKETQTPEKPIKPMVTHQVVEKGCLQLTNDLVQSFGLPDSFALIKD